MQVTTDTPIHRARDYAFAVKVTTGYVRLQINMEDSGYQYVTGFDFTENTTDIIELPVCTLTLDASGDGTLHLSDIPR